MARGVEEEKWESGRAESKSGRGEAGSGEWMTSNIIVATVILASFLCILIFMLDAWSRLI